MTETDGCTLRGLITDWGGVFTSNLRAAMSSWMEVDGIDRDYFDGVMREWLGRSYGTRVDDSPVHALERGEIAPPDFERTLAARLRTLDGGPVAAPGLLERMFGGFEIVTGMYDVMRRAKAAGLRTCLLSNSWGVEYPRDGWAEMFDTIVISGEVGMRKPEQRIFRHALELIDLPAAECVFIDDIRHNVYAAEDMGMVGIRHTDVASTVKELRQLVPGFDLDARRS